ncbi:DUF1800 domain-containing protein [Arcticibacterium luteifluviistationis]|uniref:DUF1800 domain-containing protein n=1 Tax=Arcticibacterium luteifluviistationis TaxID=1784714 RepID=A0A2Z4GED0_9BACT|nr:DUF1800 domain-containing protein [Arcticibacterium luteifluviistationis]AWV99385.1 DUF1800 domain-containing protein [Arcticibacterium luteifluviistationis]
MPYLDLFTGTLTSEQATHLLRRATMGPTQAEITQFTGMTANTAVDLLISNCNTGPSRPPGNACTYNHYSEAPPVCENDPTDYTTPRNPASIWPVRYTPDLVPGNSGLPFVEIWVDLSNNFRYWKYVKYWWIAKMVDTSVPPSILEKVSLFWQNHFVTNTETVDEYRGSYYYLKIIRENALGNFKTFVDAITKSPAMLRYLNGNENIVGAPNENYARELQELFVVGATDYNNQPNYTEDDIKEAAKVLTGWKDNFTNYGHSYTFNSSNHDTTNKTFSSHYGNTSITGNYNAQVELDNLINMLVNHPESPKYICRKLYRWFVHTDVTPAIETNVIIPLAALFINSNYEITPVIKKLLKSQHFYDISNIGSLVKSPVDLIIGALRFFELPAPYISSNDSTSFYNYVNYIYEKTNDMQMAILQQPTVFGYEPYYQTGLGRNWINSTSLAQRSSFTDDIINGSFEINSSYFLGIDLLALTHDAMNNAAGSPLLVVEKFTNHLFATPLNASQKDFLTDIIMMKSLPRNDWTFEYPPGTNTTKLAAVNSRINDLMKYLLRMAEFQLN